MARSKSETSIYVVLIVIFTFLIVAWLSSEEIYISSELQFSECQPSELQETFMNAFTSNEALPFALLTASIHLPILEQHQVATLISLQLLQLTALFQKASLLS